MCTLSFGFKGHIPKLWVDCMTLTVLESQRGKADLTLLEFELVIPCIKVVTETFKSSSTISHFSRRNSKTAR